MVLVASAPARPAAALVLADGAVHHGVSFGATSHSIAGELVFSTGDPFIAM